MQFQVGAFNDHLNGLGELFKWRKSWACPCLNPTSGSPNARCPYCSGKGRIWDAKPVDALAAVSSSKTQLEWAKFGQWLSGDMVLTIPEDSPLYEVAMYDRVLCTTSTDAFSLPLIHGALTERINGSVKSIDRVFWFDSSNNMVEGGVPTVAQNGSLSWPSGGEPPNGQAYSISGIRNNEYYCFGAFSNDRNKHQGMRLPRRMVLRLFDLFGRNGSN